MSQDTCANCGRTYMQHYGDGIHCKRSKRGSKWFPAALAVSLKASGQKAFQKLKIAKAKA